MLIIKIKIHLVMYLKYQIYYKIIKTIILINIII